MAFDPEVYTKNIVIKLMAYKGKMRKRISWLKWQAKVTSKFYNYYNSQSVLEQFGYDFDPDVYAFA